MNGKHEEPNQERKITVYKTKIARKEQFGKGIDTRCENIEDKVEEENSAIPKWNRRM